VQFEVQAGVAQLVEHQPSKLRVAGPSPVSRSIMSTSSRAPGDARSGRALGDERCFSRPRGSVVEHFLGKEGVTGSIPVVGSIHRAVRDVPLASPPLAGDRGGRV
jgi:hypothetical protein